MKKQILAIDDSEAIRFLLQTVLGSRYEVVTAADGCAAMYWLGKKQMPELIIADPQLPDMNDWELIAYLASSAVYGDIPVMVLSAFTIDETRQKCNEVNVRQFFIKPFNPVDLVKAVDQIVFPVKGKQYPVKPT